MNAITKPIHIVGLSIVTSNAQAFADNDIGKLWDVFLKTPIKEKLTDIASDSVFSVYSDYENGFQGKYKVTIGYAVKEIDNLPSGLATVTIPAGNYKTYLSKSPMPDDIVATWKIIWATDPSLLHRNFVADFEEYKGTEATITIGYE